MADDRLVNPRILVTNDDGIHAPGLKVLQTIAAALSDDVWVVAPETNQSGSSHSLTLHHPLRIRQISERRFAVDGTPTDCVLLAIQSVMKARRPDLVLSGVNAGANLGEDVTYSGTVAAAMEATLFNVPSIALSQVWRNGDQVRWETAQRHGPTLIDRLFKAGWAKDVLINVNFPDCPPEEVKGHHVTYQGKRKAGDQLHERLDPRGRPYYWIGVPFHEEERQEGSDLKAIFDNLISVTPVHLDLTHRPSFERLRAILG